MEIILSNASDRPIYEQITSQIKEMIMKGALKPGEPMPSMRKLAKDLHVSVITTSGLMTICQETDLSSQCRQKALSSPHRIRISSKRRTCGGSRSITVIGRE